MLRVCLFLYYVVDLFYISDFKCKLFQNNFNQQNKSSIELD